MGDLNTNPLNCNTDKDTSSYILSTLIHSTTQSIPIQEQIPQQKPYYK